MISHVRVDWRTSLGYTGRTLRWLTGTLALPLALAILTRDAILAFTITALVTTGLALVFERIGTTNELEIREAVLTVALTWLAAALLGALPYIIAGNGPVASPINAFFESMSGFTTTGATVMKMISVEQHSAALMMWRQETQWLGGMGIVVLAVAILPELSIGGTYLVRAEAPGPQTQKLTPRIAETARNLWRVYAAITALEIGLLYGLHLAGLAPNMGLYNAVSHGFTTMATGGFSPQARSIEAFSAVVQWVIIPFMAAAGLNFAVTYRALQNGLNPLRTDAETHFYLGTLGVVSALIAGLLVTGRTPTGELLPTLRHAIFQAVSIVTTTGYASTNFDAWSEPLKYLLLIAMFLGGSAGSTGSAVKMIRWMVVLKTLRRSLFLTAHPTAMRPIRIGDETLDERTVRDVHAFTLLYFLLFFLGTLVVLVNGTTTGTTVSALEAMSAVAATLGNVGPGVGVVGPMNNYLLFPASTKLVLTLLMWLGRLEILTVLVLFTNAYWRI